jgi:hypothetical protein
MLVLLWPMSTLRVRFAPRYRREVESLAWLAAHARGDDLVSARRSIRPSRVVIISADRHDMGEERQWYANPPHIHCCPISASPAFH